MKKSNLIYLVLLPAILIFGIGYFIDSVPGPLQSLAHKTMASLLALAILNMWLRLLDIQVGIDFSKDIKNIEKHQRIVYIRTRFVCCAAIVGAIFAFA